MHRLDWVNTQLQDSPFLMGERYTVADITGMIAVDFLKPAKLAVPEALGSLKRWHEDVSSRPSAKA